MKTVYPKRRPVALVALTLATMLLAGCNSRVLDYRNAQIANGKVYAGDANAPFSGTLTNTPSSVILEPQAGFRKMVTGIERVLPTLTFDYVRAAGIDDFPTDPRIPVPVYCDAHVDTGVLDGKTVCKAANTDNVRLEMTFKGGQLDGRLTAYTPESASHIFATVGFKNGEPDGRQEIYSPSTHKLVHVSNWTEGVPVGQEEGFDQDSGNRVLLATYDNGQLDGTFTRYAPDGKQVIYRATFADGKLEGKEEGFDPQTGKPTGYAEYVGGKLQGTVRRWNASGKLIYEKDYQDGQEVPDTDAVIACLDRRYTAFGKATGNEENVDAAQRNEWEAACKEEQRVSNVLATSPASAAPAESGDVDNCVSNWTAAYRRENGADAMVTDDQIGEWKSWCKAGKQPS